MTDFKKRRLVPPLLTVWRNCTISTIVKGILLSPISTYISFYPLISLLNFPIIFGYFTTHFIPCHCHYWLSNQKFFPFGYQPTNHPSNTTYSLIWMYYRMAYEMLYYVYKNIYSQIPRLQNIQTDSSKCQKWKYYIVQGFYIFTSSPGSFITLRQFPKCYMCMSRDRYNMHMSQHSIA